MKSIYRGFYSFDGEHYEYIKIVATSREQAKRILDAFIEKRVGKVADRSPLPDWLAPAYTWQVGEVHGDADHDWKGDLS